MNREHWFVIECWYRNSDLDDWNLAMAFGAASLSDLPLHSDLLRSSNRQIRVQRIEETVDAG